jgi:predicted amidohydrolase YtcJ
MPRLNDCDSPADCLSRIRDECLSLTPGAWLLACGVRVEGWREPRWPTRAELDLVTGDHPVAIMSFDHHAVLANSRAMAAAGFRDESPDPPGGVIRRDRHAIPTGLLLESAAYQAWRAAPEPSPSERRAHLRAAIDDLAGHGFIEAHDLLSQSWLGPELASLDRENPLPMSIQLFCPLDEFEQQAQSAETWAGPRTRLAGAKLFSDGTLNSATAWMLHPYADPIPEYPNGKPMVTAAQLDDAIARVRRLGLELAVHAIGDGAVRAVLDAAQRAASLTRRPDHPFLRIEHCELIDEADVPRFADLNVIASVQPCHLLADIEVINRQLSHRRHRVLPLRDLIDSGCAPGSGLIFGSDAPIVRPHPRDSIIASTLRRREDMPASASIAPDQAITQAESWAAFAPSR